MVIHWTRNDQLLSFLRHLKIYAIHVGAYWGGCRTPITFKMEHLNIATDKYPQINTVKILHETFFLLKKTCYVNHALSFIHSSFCQTFFRRLYIEFLDFTHICDNRLTPGSNSRPYALSKPATFTNGFLTFYRFLSIASSYHQA